MMQDDVIPSPGHSLPRRAFLRQSGAGLAALACAPLIKASSVGATTRSKPAHPVVLRSKQFEVVLDEQQGLPYEFRLEADLPIGGEATGKPMTATLCRRKSGTEFFQAELTSPKVHSISSQADFDFVVQHEGEAAASFAVRYRVENFTVYVTLENIAEQQGYELIDVAMPSLVTVRESDTGAWLAHGEDGGSLAMLSEANTGSLAPNTFWGNVMASLPVLMVSNGHVTCVQEVTANMDGSALTVAGEAGSRYATLGSVRAHRVKGSLCWDMNTGPNTPRNCGTAATPNLIIEQRPACRLDFLAAGSKPADWLAAARLVRARMPAMPTHYYDDKVVYGIHCDEPKLERPDATFQQCREFIALVAALTDRAPQVVHLWGWQYRGKDTGYPAVAEVDPRVGTYEQMMQLMEDARSLSCNVTLSDNYDDAYRSSPLWDEAIIARRPDGGLWKSRNWTGEDSYVLGMAKYIDGPGLERIRYTCERYRIRETTHVDVLSYFPIRNDWDPQRPASGIKNLQARYRVLEEFRKRGIDVSSEALRYAMIGHVSCFWYAQGPRACPFGGKPIPLLATIYRKSALWGQSGNRPPYVDRLLHMLFYNGCAHMIIRADMDAAGITDHYYLMMVPWFRFARRNIESFRRDGDRTVIGLEGGASIDIDWKAKSYVVTDGGSEITRDQTLTCPLDDNRVAFYSTEAKELSAPLPAGWDASQIAAFAISASGRERATAQVQDGRIRVSAQPRVPIIIYRKAPTA